MTTTATNNPTFDTLASNWITSLVGDRSENTVNAYRRDLAQFSSYLATHRPELLGDVQAIAAEDVSGFLGSMEELTIASLARKQAAIRSFFRALKDLGHVAANPTDGITAPRPDKVAFEGVVPDHQAVRRVVERAPEGSRDRAILELLALGLTSQEVCDLSIRAVDLEEGVVTVYSRTGDRRVALPTPAWEALRLYLTSTRPQLNTGANAYHAFLNYAGRALGRQTVWSVARDHSDGAFNPNDLRRAAIVGALAAGVPLDVVSKQAGHSDPYLTKRYMKLVNDPATAPETTAATA